MRFTFPHSHAYPGGRVAISDDGETGSEGMVTFGDGVTVIAEWRSQGDGIHLSVPAYRTAKGTRIAAKSWRLTQRKDGVWRSDATS